MHNQLALWLQGQGASASVNETILALARSAVAIDREIRLAAIGRGQQAQTSENVQGEDQKTLDVVSNQIVMEHLAGLDHIAAMVSEEVEHPILPSAIGPQADQVVCFDPLDGSSNIASNCPIGTIFSILGVEGGDRKISEANILAASGKQLAAGYVLYGPATVLVVTTTRHVAMFALDPDGDGFMLVNDRLTIPETCSNWSINASYERYWDTAITTYVRECVAGREGPRGRDFNTRWSAAMVADIHRLFFDGGVFIYPALKKPGSETGKLRFFYEANPMALLAHRAGGRAIASGPDILDIRPTGIHQRVPVIIGSREEVDRIAALYG